jgi:hypothetical protein
MIDATILAGLLGVGGSIAGTILGYKLNNNKADIKVYIDGRISIYYLKEEFGMYLPITITNEGSKSSTISDFKVKLTSPTNQIWDLNWYYFADDNTLKDGVWEDTRRSNPILVHGNSGIQYYLKLMHIGFTEDGFSNVSLPSGQYSLELETYDRDRKPSNNQSYKFDIATGTHESLAKKRLDKEDSGTHVFDLK